MNRPENTPEIFFYDDLGEPRKANAPHTERYPDFAQVFPEHARRLLAQAGFRNTAPGDADNYEFIVRPTTPDEYAQGITTDQVVEIQPRF